MTALNTPYATLSFANIFSPRPRAEGGNPVYNCSLIFDPAQQKSPAYKALQDACIQAARKEFGDNTDPKKIEMPFRDAGKKEYDGYHGYTHISAVVQEQAGRSRYQSAGHPAPTKSEWPACNANVVPFAWSHTAARAFCSAGTTCRHPERRAGGWMGATPLRLRRRGGRETESTVLNQ
jgi:hypothetical protein